MHRPSVPVEKRPYRCLACLTALGVTLRSAAISAAVRSGCAEAGIPVSEDDIEKLVSYIDETIAWFNSMKDSTPKKEAQKKGKKPSCRKFLVTAEEEASVGE